MSSGEDARITLKDLLKPDLADWKARIEALERDKAARGEFVEVMNCSWFSDSEERIMDEPDRYIAEMQ